MFSISDQYKHFSELKKLQALVFLLYLLFFINTNVKSVLHIYTDTKFKRIRLVAQVCPRNDCNDQLNQYVLFLMRFGIREKALQTYGS